jgi:CCR4-NOT transcription complex subunit 4
MWCWHRIRESESGLCPACRTPYGDDPHEFSAVDVADVLKANKEKAAAEKRERERLRHDHGDESAFAGGAGQMDVPKDRSSLANMRVIRRNLVYAVGLPPNIATEDALRKPEYFGQYGKIAKIVLNRTNVTSSDPRRASASAYVTFVHKEDTLACILALDGFFLDGRNIRASYGTSKYCSAFIKNVRCNNPDCTYLHCMGDAEDTFTKQEIQAGYVTSGRDVLARQQQIVAEQLSAAGGASGAGTRRKVGGGGPSGTGKASANPVFPPPVYDEPLKQSTTPLVPSPASMNRSKSVTAAPVTAAVAPAPKIGRSASLSTGSSSLALAPTRKSSLPTQNVSGLTGATAASVVAGVHSLGNTGAPEPPSAPHTTLTPLTPLKRTSTRNKSSSNVQSQEESTLLPSGASRTQTSKLSSLRSNNKSNNAKSNGMHGTAPTSPSSSVSSVNTAGKLASQNNHEFTVGSIGGIALGPPGNSTVGGSSLFGSSSSSLGNPFGGGGLSFDGGFSEQGSGALGGQPIGGTDPIATSSSLGGDVFTGQLPTRSDSAIRTNDKWNSAGPADREGGLFGHTSSSSISGGDIWGSEIGGGMAIGSRAPGVIGGSNSSLRSIGPGDSGLGPGSSFNSNSGSSALASMLGINLPTGSGSLREASSLWNGPASSQNPAPSLYGESGAGVIGSANRTPGGGGIAIGGGGGGMPNGGLRSSISMPPGSGNNSDIALLQSLLPGVHITSGNAKQPAARGSSASSVWNPMAGTPIGQPIGHSSGGFGIAGAQEESWAGGSSGRANGGRRQEQNQGGIW